MTQFQRIFDAALAGMTPAPSDALQLAECKDIGSLLQCAGSLRDGGFGSSVTYSRKIFIPLTQLCRDVCHYCTFAQAPKRLSAPYMKLEEVVELAEQGRAHGCKEALFTLGEKPALR